MTEYAKQYEDTGLKEGKTVAEWEAAMGLPKFSVYPEVKDATTLSRKGYFMYRNATDDERVAMTKGTFRKNYGDIKLIEEKKAARREQDRLYKASKR